METSKLLLKNPLSPESRFRDVGHRSFKPRQSGLFDDGKSNLFSEKMGRPERESLGPHLRYFLVTVSSGLLIALALYMVLLGLFFG
jgi:hypothetical protein